MVTVTDRRPRIGGLFYGYGGLDMAVQQVLGGDLAWYSEIDEGACRIASFHHPGIPNLGDITQINWNQAPRVDVLTGGFPCQDVSTAGARAGLRDGTRTGLWAHMLQGITVLRPALVVAENVRGLLSATADSEVEPCPWCLGDDPDSHMRALGAVLADLADIGYDAQWVSIRASDVGACHRRERVFIAAHPKGHPWRQLDGDPLPAVLTTPGRLLPTPTANLGRNGGGQDAGKRRTGGHSVSIEDAVISLPKVTLLPTPTAARFNFGEYGPAIDRHERIFGRSAPSPTEPGKNGGARLAARFAEWMMCLPDGWVTDPAIWEGMTDTAARNAELHALGNGVVPPQAVAALRWLIRVGQEHP